MKLQIRITLIIAAIAISAGVILTLMVSDVMHDALEYQLEKRGLVIVQTLSEYLTENVIEGEYIAVHNTLLEVVQHTDDVDFAFIVDFNENIFAHTFERGFPSVLHYHEHETDHPEAPHLEKYTLNSESGLLFVHPLIEGMSAHIHLGLNETYLHDQIAETKNRIIAITVSVALVSILIGFLLSTRLTRPLEQLSDSLQHFAGELIVPKLSYHGGGSEVADLTRSFNQMIVDCEQAEGRIRTLATIVEQSSEGMALVNLEGYLIFINRAWAEMHDFDSPEELDGQHLSIFHNRKQLETEVLRFNEKVLEKGFHRGEVNHIRRDGTVFPTRMTSSIVADNTGKPIAMAGLAIDITEQKQLEERLLQSQKMQTIGLLSAGVAHDFNNILQAIIGYSEHAKSMLDDNKEILGDLEEINISVEKASKLTAQLLAVGRRPVLELKYTDMNNLISEYLRMFRRVISNDIRVGLIEGHELGTVYVDSGQMEQVLMNLCINSRDAMPEGGSITIETENVLITEEYSRTHPVNLQGHFVLVSITDTGCGMSEETCSKIFEPYFTTKGIGMGSGLGLITAFGIIDQHNGFITVKSELGKGSTFKIYLPVAEQCNEKAGTSINSKAAGGTETILLAEDDEAVQRFTIQVLEGYGYTVLPTEDGPKALNILKNHAPDISLAMLAIALPGMGGRDIYDEIQKINPDIRVILTSGYSHNGIHTRTVLNEEIHSICKPYSPDTLLRMVRAVLDE